MTNDSAAICIDCNATDKPMSNSNGRTWICDDCAKPKQLSGYKTKGGGSSSLRVPAYIGAAYIRGQVSE